MWSSPKEIMRAMLGEALLGMPACAHLLSQSISDLVFETFFHGRITLLQRWPGMMLVRLLSWDGVDLTPGGAKDSSMTRGYIICWPNRYWLSRRGKDKSTLSPETQLNWVPWSGRKDKSADGRRCCEVRVKRIKNFNLLRSVLN